MKLNPLTWNVPIVFPGNGTPTPEFIRQLLDFLKQIQSNTDVGDAPIVIANGPIPGATPNASVLTEGTGIDLDQTPGALTVALEDTAVTPGTYGDSTHVAQVTVDQQGRLTAISDVLIAGGGGGVYVPVVDGSIPPVFITLPDGNLVYVQVA
jgi:type V secretory pathway adhesin AidA